MKKRLLVLFVPITLVWSGWFLLKAFDRWQFSYLWPKIGMRFIPVELTEDFHRAMDWQTPLSLALAPIAALAVLLIVRHAHNTCQRSLCR